jgi:hypothetical protein
MKRNISKLIGIVVVLNLLCCAVLAMITTAVAAAPASIKLGSVTVNDGYYLKEGTTSPSTTKPASGGYAYYKSGVLQLYNFDAVTTNSDAVSASGDLTVELVGANTIKTGAYGIEISGDLTVRGSGALTITASGRGGAIYTYGNCTIESGTLTASNVDGNSCVFANDSYTQKGGNVSIKAEVSNSLYAKGLITLQGGSLTLDGAEDSYSAMRADGGVSITNGDLTIFSCGLSGIYCPNKSVQINGNSEIDINVDGDGIQCNALTVSNVEQLLVSAGNSQKAFSINSISLSMGLACSASQTNDGNNAYALTSSNYSLAKYAYIRSDIDLYVGGIPMGIGDYLHQSWGAASTYKPGNNYAKVDLNGDTDELYLKNFNLDTTNSSITSTAVTTTGSLKLYLDGVNSINSGTGDAICVNKGSLTVISGGTLNITTTSGAAIRMKEGSYIHGGNAIINVITTNATAVDAMNKNVTVNSGELNVTAKYDGISCANFTITGGKVDTRSTNNENNKGLSYTTISYGSLIAKAASTADGALVTLTSAHKTANKRVVIASHICSGQHVSAKGATCTANGKQAYYKCSCGKYYEDVNCSKVISDIGAWGVIVSQGHSPITGWATNGTYHWKTCTKCSITEIPNTKVKHSGGEATCRAKAMCDICKVYYGEIGYHKWSATWDYATSEGHVHFCVNDGCDIVSAYEAHVPNISAPTETQDQKCKLCDYVIASALGHVCKNHVYKVEHHGATCIDFGNIEYYECTCGKYFKDKDATTEITDKSSVRIPKIDHEYLDNWYSDANGHWQQCDCLRKGNEAPHKDDNGDYICDVCFYALPKPSTTPTAPDTTTAPTPPDITTAPTDPDVTTAPTDPDVTTAPTDPDITTAPTDPDTTEKPTEPDESNNPYDGTENPTEGTESTDYATDTTDKNDGQKSNGMPWWIILPIVIVVVGAGVGITIVVWKKKK